MSQLAASTRSAPDSSSSRLSLSDPSLSSSSSSTSVSIASAATSPSKQQENTRISLPNAMEYLERDPVLPPSYRVIHQNGAPTRYPVYEAPETYVLPEYTPSVHQITLVLRKVEWLSPYEPSSSRSWKNLIMELNSTQVNFYSMEGLPLLDYVKKSKSKKHYMFNEIERDHIIKALERNPSKYLMPDKLVKSYTLQYGKFGIPIDYKKRNYCLRMRLETEQMIVQYSSLDEMIDWANYLSTGINVSLDLDTREMPTDRTVPRRRRNRRNNRNRSYSDSELLRRQLSPPMSSNQSFARRASSSGEQFIKSKISRIFGKSRSSPMSSTKKEPAHVMNPLHKIIQQNASQMAASTHTSSSSSSSSQEIELILDHDDSEFISHLESDISTIIETQNEQDVEEDDEEDNNEEDLEDEIPDNELHSIHQLHDDSDDDDEISDDYDNLGSTHSSNTRFNQFSFTHAYDTMEAEMECFKWKPDPKTVSRRKFLKDSLRCIKLLPNDECWVGKVLVRTTSPPNYKTCNEYARRNTKNKFVREFVVGAHALVAVDQQQPVF